MPRKEMCMLYCSRFYQWVHVVNEQSDGDAERNA
jgi:hypothetical protein